MVQSASSYGPRRFELVSDVTCLVMRREIRILGNSSQQLWSKGSNQSAYKPSDLHITHVCFYSVHPKLAHTDHLGLELYTYNLDGGTPVPMVDETSSFVPESPTLTKKIAQYVQPTAMGTYELRRAPPPMRILILGKNRERSGESQLAETAAGSASSSGSQSAEADGKVTLRILFEQWLSHQRSLARIGTYDNLSEVQQCSESLQGDVGKLLLLPRGLDSITKFRIAVEISYSYLTSAEHHPDIIPDDDAEMSNSSVDSGVGSWRL